MTPDPTSSPRQPVLLVHGGAGVIRESLTPAIVEAVEAALREALRAGHAVLAAEGSALDAVSAAVLVLEDSPYFNAGKGAVFTHEGGHELDASIMEGHTRRAGSVAGVQHIRNPIALARAVLEKSDHVMLFGAGAEAFAATVGAEFVDAQYFHTDERWKQWQDALHKEAAGQQAELGRAIHYGTVGAVALDVHGHLAAATSTGGMTNKRWGRVGDSPLIGAGTWADARVGVSATGWGEFFIRCAVAHDIAARVAYRGDTLQTAAEEVIVNVVPALGGDGGAIAIDRDGNIAMPFSTIGMYRGWITRDGTRGTAIFDE